MTTKLDPRSWLYPTPRGLYCEPGEFYIDPAVAVPRAVITHGHGDHARPGHRAALATPETLAIMRARFEGMPDTSQQALKYGESVRLGEIDLELAPAGHILGSAQAVLAFRGQRIVISGDFKLRRSVATFPDHTHLVGVYALGKCQRVIKLLRAAGWDRRIWLHGSLLALCKLYQDHGVDLGDVAHVSDAILETFRGAIVLCPPGALADRWSRG